MLDHDRCTCDSVKDENRLRLPERRDIRGRALCNNHCVLAIIGGRLQKRFDSLGPADREDNFTGSQLAVSAPTLYQAHVLRMYVILGVLGYTVVYRLQLVQHILDRLHQDRLERPGERIWIIGVVLS